MSTATVDRPLRAVDSDQAALDSGRAPFVLFLCCANRARSQMAEAILRDEAPNQFEVRSAGLRPEPIHPITTQVLEEIGIDTSSLRAKSVLEYFHHTLVDCAIIVCNETEADCPRMYPFCYRVLHWPFEDPVRAVGTENERLEVFREVRDQIRKRIRQWLRDNPLGNDARQSGRSTRARR